MYNISKKMIDKSLMNEDSTKKYLAGKNFFSKKIINEIELKLLLKVALTIILISLITVYAGAEIIQLNTREVVLNDNGSVVIFNSRSNTVGEFLINNNIYLRDEDIIYPSRAEQLFLTAKSEIFIQRAIPVKVYVDNQELLVYTQKHTIKDVLAEKQIVLNPNDELVDLNLENPIYSNINIRIIRIKEDIITEKETLAFETIKRPNQRLDQGVEKIVREGKEGIKEYSYKVVYEDGEIKSKELVNENITNTPIDKVVEYGTIASKTTSRGEKFRYKQVLDMRATAYTASFADTGKNPGHPQFGITYTGMKVKRGVIAVDPRIIPLGSRVYVEGVGKTPDYGYAVAADTGGAIKGKIIDLYVDSQSEANNWGIRNVKVYILEN